MRTPKRMNRNRPIPKLHRPRTLHILGAKSFWLLWLFVVLAASAYVVWRVFFAKPKLPDSIVTLSGRIEGDESAIAAKSTGRVLEIRFREGDAVQAGDVIAILSDEQVRARQEQAQAGVSIMEAKGKAALDQIAVLEQQMQQNQLQTSQSKVDAEGRVRQAEGRPGSRRS